MVFPVTITFAALYGIAPVPLTRWIGSYRNKIGILRSDAMALTQFPSTLPGLWSP